MALCHHVGQGAGLATSRPAQAALKRRRTTQMSDTKDPAVWMWAQACELIDQAERLHRQFFRPTVSARAFAVWEPPIDVFEDEHELVIVVAMPGVTSDRVAVKFEPGAVV